MSVCSSIVLHDGGGAAVALEDILQVLCRAVFTCAVHILFLREGSERVHVSVEVAGRQMNHPRDALLRFLLHGIRHAGKRERRNRQEGNDGGKEDDE